MATPTNNAVNGNRAQPIRVFLILAIIAALLWFLDWSLEKTEVAEFRAEAERNLAEGSRLLKQGKPGAAIDPLRRAYALDRKNATYELTLITALMAARKPDEAQPLMDDILQREPNDGWTNLIAARLMESEGKASDAASYYHRAIYGAWPANTDASRRAVRIELIDFLLKHDRKRELLAELLPLEESTDGDLALNQRIAGWMLVAGSPTRAADLYRSLIAQNPQNADLYAGLGEADLVLAQYHAAVSAFLSAYRHRPGDAGIRQRMEFSSLMAGLDPTPRKLSSMEKYERSLRILERTRTDYDQCTASQGQPLEASATSRPPAHVTNELAEEKLAEAEQIWRARLAKCGPSTSAEEEPLRLIMAKLAQ